MTKIRLSETKPGDTAIIAGREYTVLDTDFQGAIHEINRWKNRA